MQEVGGNHYEKFRIEPVNIMVNYNLNWFQGEALKYISRYQDKGGIGDLEKAIHVMEMANELQPFKANNDITNFHLDYNAQFEGIHNQQDPTGKLHLAFEQAVYTIILGNYDGAIKFIKNMIRRIKDIDNEE